MTEQSKAWVSPVEFVGSSPAGGTDVCCECRVLSRRGLCDETITRPEESYSLWCVVVWSRNLKHEETVASIGRSATVGRKIQLLYL